MKPSISWLLLVFSLQLHSQNTISHSALKLAAGYALEYPGPGGYSINLEYDVPVISSIQVGLGTRILQLSGYPRTDHIHKFTNAETIDFNLCWSPLETGIHTISLGLGYLFCFYDVRRAFPVSRDDIEKPLEWMSQESNGRTRGFSI